MHWSWSPEIIEAEAMRRIGICMMPDIFGLNKRAKGKIGCRVVAGRLRSWDQKKVETRSSKIWKQKQRRRKTTKNKVTKQTLYKGFLQQFFPGLGLQNNPVCFVVFCWMFFFSVSSCSLLRLLCLRFSQLCEWAFLSFGGWKLVNRLSG